MKITKRRITCQIIDAQSYEDFDDLGDENSNEETNSFEYGIILKLQNIDDDSEVLVQRISADELKKQTGAKTLPNTKEIIRIAKRLRDETNLVSVDYDEEINDDHEEDDEEIKIPLKANNVAKVIKNHKKMADRLAILEDILEEKPVVHKFQYTNGLIGTQTEPHYSVYPGEEIDE